MSSSMLLFGSILLLLSPSSTNAEMLPLPHFNFDIFLSSQNLGDFDLYQFHQHFDHVTENHLHNSLQDLILSKAGILDNVVIQVIHLTSTVKTTSVGTNDHERKVVQATFGGQADVSLSQELVDDAPSSSSGNVNPGVLHYLVDQSFAGDEYWKLMHKISENTVLHEIDSLTVEFDEEAPALEDVLDLSQPANPGAVATLTIFGLILFGSAAYLALLAYRRYRMKDGGEFCCSNHSKASSDTTEEDDEDLELFDDEQQRQRSPQPRRKNSTKSTKRRSKHHNLMLMDAPSLDSIQEDVDEDGEDEDVDDDEEEGMMTVPLENPPINSPRVVL